MILMVGGHVPDSIERQKEYEICLRNNLENSFIEKICLFVEQDLEAYVLKTDNDLLKHEKLRVIPHYKRLTFLSLFNYANENFAGEVVIISNSDIYHDNTIQKLIDFDFNGVFIALSRAFDVINDGLSEHRPISWGDSQDTWVFRVPIKIDNCDFNLGIRGCDNRIVSEALAAGYRVINPVSVIKTFHVHSSMYRTYDAIEPVSGPYQSCFNFSLE